MAGLYSIVGGRVPCLHVIKWTANISDSANKIQAILPGASHGLFAGWGLGRQDVSVHGRQRKQYRHIFC